MRIFAVACVALVSAAALPALAEGPGTPPALPRWLDVLASAGRPLAERAGTAPAETGDPQAQRDDKWEKEYRTLFPAYVDEGLARWLDIEYFVQPHFQVDYAATLHRDRSVSGQSADMAITQHDFGIRVNPFEDLYYPPYTPTFNLRILDIRTDAVLPDTGGRFPRQLWDLRISQTIVLGIPGAVDVTMGSASDRPFDSADEFTADITWFTGVPYNKAGPIFLINWANNRDYLNQYPIPGGGLRWQYDNLLRCMFGFPYNALYVALFEQFPLFVSYQFPRTVHARLQSGGAPLTAFAGFDWTNRRFFRHDRRTRDDRLWYLEKRIYGGLKWDITNDAYFEIIGGYAFDRFFFEGGRYEDRSFNRINIADGPFLMLQVGLRF